MCYIMNVIHTSIQSLNIKTRDRHICLTLILLNKLCLPHPFLTVSQSDNWMLFALSIHKLNEKQCRSWSDGFFRSHLIWIYIVFKGNAYPGSAGQGLINSIWIGKLSRNIPVFYIQMHINLSVNHEEVHIFCAGYKAPLVCPLSYADNCIR